MNREKKFLDRELSTLEFSARVLAEAMDPSNPLLERLKFVATLNANLDEFYMVRVASLKAVNSPLDAIHDRARTIVKKRDDYVNRILIPELEEAGLVRVDPSTCTPEQKEYLRTFFFREVFPILIPMALTESKALPILLNLQLHVVVSMVKPGEGASPGTYGIIEVPQKAVARLLFLPIGQGHPFVQLEDLIAYFAPEIFLGYDVTETGVMRLTRGMELTWDEEKDEDFIQVMMEALRRRHTSEVVRLEVSSRGLWAEFLRAKMSLTDEELQENHSWIDRPTIAQLALRPGFEHLKRPRWEPRLVPEFTQNPDVWSVLKEKNVVLLHPYQPFSAVSRFLERAAEDPDVLAIKQTIYRTDRDSAILSALEKAARNGKRVAVSLEIKARFDEENNMAWARRLAQSGVHVFYGVAGLKTHAKVCLVVRREPDGLRRYAHLSTGNYSAENSRTYSDIGYMTSDDALTHDIAAFFNMITGGTQPSGWKKIETAPHGLRRKVLSLIHREIQNTTPARPGIIRAKMNSLTDPEVIEALYQASLAGVQIHLNVRGICCLKPGVRGLSDNIRVISIVDRFLEHSRIYSFGNGGEEDVYLASADWMSRNLDRRLELMVPIEDEASKRRIVDTLELYFQDNVKAWSLQPDGGYLRVSSETGRRHRAQEALCQWVSEQELLIRKSPLVLPQNLGFHPEALTPLTARHHETRTGNNSPCDRLDNALLPEQRDAVTQS